MTDRDIFKVRDVSVRAHKESGIAAQTDAKNQAFKIAFDKLVRRITLGVPPAYLFEYTPEQISPFVESYNVSNELLSHDSYQATFEVEFSKRAIMDVFAGADTKALITAQPPVLLVPVLRHGDNVAIWGQKNTWGEYLRTNPIHTPLQAYRLPRGDLFDMSTWPVTVYPRYRQSVGKSFGSQYYVTRLVVAELVTQSDGKAGLNLIAYDIGTGNVLNSQSLNLAATDETAVEMQAIEHVIDFLESIAKLSQEDQVAAPQQEEFVLTVHHKGLDDFETLLDEVARVKGVTGLHQLSVNTTSANLRVLFSTSFEDLMSSFEARGYVLVKVGSHIILKRASAFALPAPQMPDVPVIKESELSDLTA